MALVVIDSQGTANNYPTAVAWHIDDDGYLHVAELTPDGKVLRRPGDERPKTRPVASFAPGCWASVHFDRSSVGPFGRPSDD